jgi:hypothetical protein
MSQSSFGELWRACGPMATRRFPACARGSLRARPRCLRNTASPRRCWLRALGGPPGGVAGEILAVTDHAVTLTLNGPEKIMKAATCQIFSSAAQLGSLTLYPSIDLTGWYIAP